jgi:hypothetical protein
MVLEVCIRLSIEVKKSRWHRSKFEFLVTIYLLIGAEEWVFVALAVQV